MTETILKTILDEMAQAQDVITGGISKKEYVMNKIKEHMDIETYDKYEAMISLIIDFIKYLSKNIYVLDALKTQNCFLSCIK